MYRILKKILTRVHEEGKRIPLTNDSKFIFFSDTHMGNNSYADDFAHNRNILHHALRTYNDKKFNFVLLGDGIEFWENNLFADIFEAHKNVFLKMKEFHSEGRLHLLWGNHDMILKNPRKVKKYLYRYFDEAMGNYKELFKGITIEESIILDLPDSEKDILLIHGHQADYFNYALWRVNRFLVQVLWTPLQVVGIKNPASPAKNYRDLKKVERTIKRWIQENDNQIIIAGHTHRPRFPNTGDIPYFNDGSCVHPRFITGIEIENLEISLVKWSIVTNKEGMLQIKKSVLNGPKKIENYIN